MSAGKLNQRIHLQSRVMTENTRGEIEYVFQTFYSCWSEVNPKKGREFIAGGGFQASLPTVFRIRYRTGIDHTMRVVWRGENYEVTSPPVEPFGAKEWLDLHGSKGTGDARKPGI